MKIKLIAALSNNRVIGINNQLPWHVPEDFAHFKKLTEHQHILMGRNTWESIFNLRQKPLPNRHHVVISRSALLLPQGVDLANSIEAAISLCRQSNIDNNESKDICIIGGAQIYEQSLAFVDVLELTYVHVELEGDAFFPELPHGMFKEVDRRSIVSAKEPFYEASFVSYRKNTL